MPNAVFIGFLLITTYYVEINGLALPASSSKSSVLCKDEKIREKYCTSADPDDIEKCLSCYVGPHCPVPGKRGSIPDDGMFLIRGITERKIQKLIVTMLNKKRMAEAWSRCIPLFTWDPDLATAAQAWADQCALVEYSANQSIPDLPQRLHHDPMRQRAASIKSNHLANEAGVAQSVHWARTGDFDLNGKILEALVDSDLTTEDGLFDGLITNLPSDVNSKKENFVAFGQATHVGCGWIQFPTSEPSLYENFMVCNYGVGLTTRTSCDNMTKSGNNENGTFIKYFTVTSEVIRDVKSCLEAVRCRRRKKKLFKTFERSDQSLNDPCTTDVQQCLNGRSGLKFVDATKLKSVARSNEDRPIDVEAAKCKIDTILCGLNSTLACKERLEHCLPLIEIEAGRGSNVLCECSDLTLADGTRGDCSQKIFNPDFAREQPFCFVKQSPCVVIDPKDGGHLELSRPYSDSNDLLHYTHFLC